MLEFLNQIIPNIMNKLPEFGQSIIDFVIMLVVAGFISMIFGTILGVILTVTREGDILENKVINFILGKIVDLFRAIPFIILIGFIVNVTRFIAGTSIGVRGAIFPLIVGTIPFFARQVESALSEIDRGLIEASQSMGCSPWEIITRVYLKESIPSLIRATTITFISLIGLITMVGAIGGGGIGDFAIRYGYNNQQTDVTNVCVIVLLIFTSTIQGIGNFFVRKTTH